ncbi:hypothetical protein BBP40_006438 [Aspergillus hancockii]|nr:hypothetical protein BBP40_006438 [Aspergillus hancockii]
MALHAIPQGREANVNVPRMPPNFPSNLYRSLAALHATESIILSLALNTTADPSSRPTLPTSSSKHRTLATPRPLIYIVGKMQKVQPRPFVPIVIIGGGFSGIGMACQLKRKFNYPDYIIYDRAAEKDPGCAVDIPAPMYSYSFAPNPWFSKLFPPQEEILRYIQQVAEEYDVPRHFVPRVEWKGASWQEKTNTWIVQLVNLATHEEFAQECRILVSAVGIFSTPNICDIPGVELFQGEVIHTAQWTPTNLKGKDIIIIGNGSSATQLLPAVMDDAKTVTQFIRTPQYYQLRPDPLIPLLLQRIFFFFPPVLYLLRILLFLRVESSFFYTRKGWFGAKARKQATLTSREYIRSTAPKEYWEHLMPSYEYACKRIVLDCRYVKSLQAANVHLTNDPIIRIQSNSIITQSGATYPADIILLATGFDLTQFKPEVRGRAGESVQDRWGRLGHRKAFQSIAMHGFPNFFSIAGPNSTRLYTSFIFAIENYVDLILHTITPIMENRAAYVEVKEASQAQYYQALQRDLDLTVYNGPCRSYVIDRETGQNSIIFPWNSFKLWLLTHFNDRGRDWMYGSST